MAKGYSSQDGKEVDKKKATKVVIPKATPEEIAEAAKQKAIIAAEKKAEQAKARAEKKAIADAERLEERAERKEKEAKRKAALKAEKAEKRAEREKLWAEKRAAKATRKENGLTALQNQFLAVLQEHDTAGDEDVRAELVAQEVVQRMADPSVNIHKIRGVIAPLYHEGYAAQDRQSNKRVFITLTDKGREVECII